ncbi:MAG: hypothetical protein NTU73_13115, partial [Ignavibacteriae bacterium]|nr:hypothetical protein [Ignavibacteriota bacterium]
TLKFIPEEMKKNIPDDKYSLYITLTFIVLLIVALILFFKAGMIDYILPSRFALDANHFIISILNMIVGIIFLYILNKKEESILLRKIIFIILIISALSGFFMIIQFNAIIPIVRIAYTIFDLSQVILILASSFVSIKKMYFNNFIKA